MPEADEEELRDPYLGRLLDGRYRLTRRLGSGGMGAVYEAEHEQIGRRVAIKILHPQYAADPEITRRFKNEARASGTLGHPNIAQSVDFGRTEEGAPYIAMELLEGRDLGETIAADGPLRVDRAIAIADQIADGLGAAHERGIVHRDVKPENVFLCAGDAVKILDFGISKFTYGDSSVATHTGAFMGSPNYMAPEQVRDASRADARTDVYSLGALIYAMLSGGPLFTTTSLPMLVIAITHDMPAPLCDVRTDVPGPLSDVVARLLAKEPADRPQSMLEVREALSAFEAVDSAPMLLIPKPAPAEEDPVARSMPDVAGAAESRIELPTRSRSTALILGAVAAAAVGIGIVAAGAWEPEPEPAEPPTSGSVDTVPAPPTPSEASTVATSTGGVDAGAPDAGPAPSAPSEPAARIQRRGRRGRREPASSQTSRPDEREAPANRIDGVPFDDTY